MSLPTNWDDYEKLLHHGFYNELCVAPEETGVLVAVPSCMSSRHCAKITQLMFETFNVPALQLMSAAALSLFTSGRDTGVAVELGIRNVTITPVFDGYPITDGAVSVPVGGRDITDYLMKLLTERGYSFTTTAEREIVRDIKEKLSYVAFDIDQEMQTAATSSSLEKSYELPDGQVITVGNERFRCQEALFCPELLGHEGALGLSDAVLLAVMNVEPELRRTMLANIVLAGGPGATVGLAERLGADLQALLPEGLDVKVIAPPEVKYMTWIGGSIASSISSTASHIITVDDYNAKGPMASYRARTWV